VGTGVILEATAKVKYEQYRLALYPVRDPRVLASPSPTTVDASTIATAAGTERAAPSDSGTPLWHTLDIDSGPEPETWLALYFRPTADDGHPLTRYYNSLHGKQITLESPAHGEPSWQLARFNFRQGARLNFSPGRFTPRYIPGEGGRWGDPAGSE